MHNECNKVKQQEFALIIFVLFLKKTGKKIQGGCFNTKLESTCKNSGSFEGKKFHRIGHLGRVPIYSIIITKIHEDALEITIPYSKHILLSNVIEAPHNHDKQYFLENAVHTNPGFVLHWSRGYKG